MTCRSTDNKDDLDRLNRFIADAIADGWSSRPTYAHEAEDQARTMDKDGFKMLVLTRSKDAPRTYKYFGKYKYELSLNAWGPDGLALDTHIDYYMEYLKKGLTTCAECGSIGSTHRVGFAGRVCRACLPEAKKRVEFPGWCD